MNKLRYNIKWRNLLMEKVLLKNNDGKHKKGIKIIISSILNKPAEKIWSKLLDVETLIYICKPMATFKTTTKDKNMKWELNKEYVFKLLIYGFIPFGNHRIILEKIDGTNKIIISKEHNKIVKIWNHIIKMENNGEDNIKYTDEVEIYAGIFTLFVAIWGIIFYKHRQRKWKKVAKEL
jgi:hypothetical protein